MFVIKKGVRQGCVASPDLFNLYQEIIMRGITHSDGIRVGGVNINNNKRYANDTAIISTSEKHLHTLMEQVNTNSKALGMEINTIKQNVW